MNKHSFTGNGIVLYLCSHETEVPIPPQPVDPSSPVHPQPSEEDTVPIVVDISFDAMETEPTDLRT